MKSIKLIATAGFMSIASMAMAQMNETDRRDRDRDNRDMNRDRMTYIDSRDRMQFGLKAGFNYSNVFDERTDDFRADPKFGFVGGGFLRIPIGRYLGLQPEVLFSQRGFKGEGMLLGNSYTFSRTTDHLDIPLLFALKPAEFLTILGGPQYSYLLRQRDNFTTTAFSQSQEEIFRNDNIRKNVLGVLVGVDINIQDVVIGARMGWDMQNNNGNGQTSAPRYKNVWLQATLGYTFRNY